MKKVLHRRRLTVTFCCLLILSAPAGTFSQDLDDTTVSGRVIDADGAAIPGVSVTVVQTETAQKRTATTDAEGRFRIVDLPPGIYNVKFAAAGFAVQEQKGFVTIAGQNLQVNSTLVPAGITAEQTITIDDEDPAIDTTRTIVGGTVTQREIEELPNASRNPLDLVLTLGGTSEEALSVRDLAEDRNVNPSAPPLEQGNFSLSGGASYSNNITIDGLDNNDDRSSLDRFQPPLESIAEVQVVTNQFSSEYGRASGGRINLRTRAGSNKFRGRAFMFFRDDALNANTYYNNLTVFNPDGTVRRAPLPKLPFTEYNPGFTLSGPVILPFGEGENLYDGRNRTFFSVSYELMKIQDTTLIDTYVPVAVNPRFNLPAPTDASVACDQTGNACALPVPTAGFVGRYVSPIDTPSIRHGFTARFDHKLTANNNFTIGYQLGRKNDQRSRFATTNRLDETIQGRISNTDAVNFTDNHTFGSNAVNQFRMQWSVFEPSYQTENPNDAVVLISVRNPLTNSRQTLTAGNSSVSGSGADAFAGARREIRWQFQDSFTYLVGGHTIKTGFDLQRIDSTAIVLSNSTGTFNFASVLDYQNNAISQFRQNFGDANTVKNTYLGFFVNDEFRPFQNLTVSYGLRYERETTLDDNNNFGPRIGIAWDPFEKGKGVVRVGAGIFYNRVLLRTVADSIQNSTPNLFQFDSDSVTTVNSAQANVEARIARQFPNGFNSAEQLRNLIASVNCGTVAAPVNCAPTTGFLANTGSAGNPLRTADPNLKIPESYQFNVGFESEIGKGFVFEANYTWNKTVHLWRDININAPVLPAGYDDWTDYLLANDFVLRNGGNGSTARRYRFVLGQTNDESGLVRQLPNGTIGGGCSTSQDNICLVNLNTFNDSTTRPTATTTGTGAAGGSIGGPVGIALLAINQFRPDPSIPDEKSYITSVGNSLYHGLVLELRSRFRQLGYGFGSSFRAVYTLSSFKDDGLNNTSNAEINGDFRREFTRNNQDRRHRFALSGTVDLPKRLGDLRLSPIFRYGSSAPFNFSLGYDRNLDDLSTDRLNYDGDPGDIVYREPGSPVPTELLSRFSLQPIGARGGNLPRNAGKGPSMYMFDLNVSREFKFSDRFRLRPNIEFGNILNARVFSYGAQFIEFLPVDTSQTAAQAVAYENILVPTRTYRHRQIRIGLRFGF